MHQLVSNLILCLLFFSIQSPTLGKKESFVVDLIHRDSPKSPLYNKSLTYSNLILEHSLESLSRLNLFDSYQETITGNKFVDSVPLEINWSPPMVGNYLMRIYIGSQRLKRWMVADTPSDLIWTQCSSPTSQGYHQDSPLFNPEDSSTYEMVRDRTYCEDLTWAKIDTSGNCVYKYAYGGVAYTAGELSKEAFYFDHENSDEEASNLIFGCSHSTLGIYNSRIEGMVGLGGGNLSLLSQIGSKFDNKFSYCLPPLRRWDITSKLKFGQQATIPRLEGEVVSTPLLDLGPVSTFYFLSLESITIGEKVTRQESDTIIVDSGTTFTILHKESYDQVNAFFKEVIGYPIMKAPGTLIECYDSGLFVDTNIPDMIFHFSGTSSLRIPISNIFLPYGTLHHCMMILPSEKYSVLGSIAQANFQVEFDLQNRRVSFAPIDCTKF